MTLAIHGTPITPDALLKDVLGRRNYCLSFFRPDQLDILIELAVWLMVDNGAYSAWMASEKSGEEVIFDAAYWRRFFDFLTKMLERRDHQVFFVMPDVINAGTQEQDALLREVPAELVQYGWPVWHLDEPVTRLLRLIDTYGRVCFGSTAEYRIVGSEPWRLRMDDAWSEIWATFGTIPETHMLRGMQCQLPSFDYPFTRVDSTDMGRNHNRLKVYGERYHWATKQKADRWDRLHCPTTWPPPRLQPGLFGEAA